MSVSAQNTRIGWSRHVYRLDAQRLALDSLAPPSPDSPPPALRPRMERLESRETPAVFFGGVRIASADVTGDSVADIVTAAGPGGAPHVRVMNGATGKDSLNFLAYDASFSGGAFVAAGDVTGDGLADIVTGAGEGGSPQVKVFDGRSGQMLSSFLAFPAAFTGGVAAWRSAM